MIITQSKKKEHPQIADHSDKSGSHAANGTMKTTGVREQEGQRWCDTFNVVQKHIKTHHVAIAARFILLTCSCSIMALSNRRYVHTRHCAKKRTSQQHVLQKEPPIAKPPTQLWLGTTIAGTHTYTCVYIHYWNSERQKYTHICKYSLNQIHTNTHKYKHVLTQKHV